MFNPAIHNKLRCRDVVRLKVEDVAQHGMTSIAPWSARGKADIPSDRN
jgi:hypothetical protein